MGRLADTTIVTALLLLHSCCDAFSPKASAAFRGFANDGAISLSSREGCFSHRNTKKYIRSLGMSGKGEIPTGDGSGKESNDDNNKAGRFPYSPDITDNSFKTVATYNWKYGLCAHKIVFEATETVKKMRFCGDLLGITFLTSSLSAGCKYRLELFFISFWLSTSTKYSYFNFTSLSLLDSSSALNTSLFVNDLWKIIY